MPIPSSVPNKTFSSYKLRDELQKRIHDVLQFEVSGETEDLLFSVIEEFFNEIREGENVQR